MAWEIAWGIVYAVFILVGGLVALLLAVRFRRELIVGLVWVGFVFLLIQFQNSPAWQAAAKPYEGVVGAMVLTAVGLLLAIGIVRSVLARFGWLPKSADGS